MDMPSQHQACAVSEWLCSPVEGCLAALILQTLCRDTVKGVQVPIDQKEPLADTLALARKEVEEYREDPQVPK